MRRLLVVLTSIMLFSLSANVQAKDMKLGVVNVGLLLEKAPQAQSASKSLEKEFGPQQAELTQLAKKLEAKQKDYQKNKLILSDAQKSASEREISLMTRDIQRKGMISKSL